MSEPVRITDWDEIMPGDLVRIEAAPEEGRADRAVEYLVGRSKLPPGWEATLNSMPNTAGRRVYRLSRPTDLPVAPYSMIAPPVGADRGDSYYLLIPHAGGEPRWQRAHIAGLVPNVGALLGRIADGWQVFPGQTLTEGKGNE